MAKRDDSKGATTGVGSFVRTDGGFSGHVFDKSDLTRRFVVELFLDGIPVRLARADAFVEQLRSDGIGDACYGYVFSFSGGKIPDHAVAEVRLANAGTPIAPSLAYTTEPTASQEPRGAGDAQWLGGLRFTGWCGGSPAEPPTVSALIDGEIVAEVQAVHWTHLGSGRDVAAVRGFDLQLPERYADGRVRRLTVMRDHSIDLTPTPLPFVAFPDALAKVVASFGETQSEKLRGKLFDQLVPMSVPFAEYASWLERYPAAASVKSPPEIAVVLVGPGEEKSTLRSVQSQEYEQWITAALPETSGQAEFEPGLLRNFLDSDGADCGIFLFLLSGTELSPAALQRVASAFGQFPEAQAVYGDVDVESEDGSRWPLAFPALDYERLLEQGYCAHLFAVRRAALENALALGASNLYRLFNSLLDEGSPQIVHIPAALGVLPSISVESCSQSLLAATEQHLKERAQSAAVSVGSGTLLPAVRVARTAEAGRVTIVIPVRDRLDLLRACLRSIAPAVSANSAEIIIVDNDSSDREMLDYLGAIEDPDVSVLRVPGAFNFSRLNNLAAEQAKGEYLCLLNNDIEARDRNWLSEMLGRIAEPDVGAVGALLLWPSGVIQHGGVVLGPAFAATHAFNDRLESDPGYADMLRAAHETSAVTAACLLTGRSDYLAVGGMDELRFPVNFNDVDYCLKLRAAGKRVVFTPHARLLHFESASRGSDVAADRAGRFERELRNLRNRWGEYLVSDSYYSPVLSLDPKPFSALAWPPRDARPRTNELPIGRDIPNGF